MIEQVAKHFTLWMATYWSLFSSGYIVAITFGAIPKENQRFADTILGFLLGTAIGAIIQFFFGTTLSSGAKNATIDKALDRLDSQ